MPPFDNFPEFPRPGFNPPLPPIQPPNPTAIVPNFNFGFDTTSFQSSRLNDILQSLYPKRGFRSIFEGLGRNDTGVNFGLGDVEALLGNPNLRDPGRISFLESLLNPAAPEVPPPHGGGGHRRRGGHGRLRSGQVNTTPTLNINPLPEPLDDALINSLLQLLEAPGIPEDVLNASTRNIQEQGALRERERLLKRSDDFAGRGIFGGGVANRDLERIETEESDRRAQQNDELMARHAATALQALQQGIGGSLGLGQLNLGSRELEVQHALQRAALELQERLGIEGLNLEGRGLDLREQQMLINSALEQYLLGLQFSGFSGGPEAPGAPPSPYPNLNNFLGGGSIPGFNPGFGGGFQAF